MENPCVSALTKVYDPRVRSWIYIPTNDLLATLSGTISSSAPAENFYLLVETTDHNGRKNSGHGKN